MSDVGEHIAAWEAQGLIDRETADRLRAAEASDAAPRGQAPPAESPGPAATTGTSTPFGPTVSIAEVFGYLGGAFLLSAWFAWFGSMARASSDSELVLGIGSGIAAIASAALGVGLHRGDERRRRAAGVAFLVAVASAGGAAASVATAAGIEWPLAGVIGSAAALATAIGVRWFHAALLTQIGLLVAITSLAAALLAWSQEIIFGRESFDESGIPTGTGPDPIILVLASAAWWLACAVLIGLIALRESRSNEPGADRRAGASRAWAGLVAVFGLATAVSRSDSQPDGTFGRVLEPWIGDLALLVVAVILIERAFRRDATSYVYAAGLALILALSDFNFTYLTESTESGLFVEGVILLGAGVGADRLRRRIGDRPTA